MEDIKKALRRFVVDHFLLGDDNDLNETTSFLERGIVDSTGVLEVVAHLQERYGIRVEDDELLPDNLDSIAAMAAFIQRKKSGEGKK